MTTHYFYIYIFTYAVALIIFTHLSVLENISSIKHYGKTAGFVFISMSIVTVADLHLSKG